MLAEEDVFYEGGNVNDLQILAIGGYLNLPEQFDVNIDGWWGVFRLKNIEAMALFPRHNLAEGWLEFTYGTMKDQFQILQIRKI